jgi:hypothetical protein
MATSPIGTYTEKRIANQISNLLKQINELENYLKTPPFIVIYGVMDLPSEFSNTDWKAHVNYVLNTNNINPNWILNTINPQTNSNCPYFVTIQFISHCVKETVFTILSDYITLNEFEGVYITKDVF